MLSPPFFCVSSATGPSRLDHRPNFFGVSMSSNAVAKSTDVQLRSRYIERQVTTSSRSIIVHELGVHYGSHRVDIAIISDSTIAGCEIKSGADTLKRLPAQSLAFSEVFDEMTLVAAPKHIMNAVEIVPEWWTIIVDDGSTDYVHRVGSTNPNVEVSAVLMLLWHEELLELCSTFDATSQRCSRRTRAELRQILLATTQRDDLLSQAKTLLVRRLRCRTAAQLESDGG